MTIRIWKIAEGLAKQEAARNGNVGDVWVWGPLCVPLCVHFNFGIDSRGECPWSSKGSQDFLFDSRNMLTHHNSRQHIVFAILISVRLPSHCDVRRVRLVGVCE